MTSDGNQLPPAPQTPGHSTPPATGEPNAANDAAANAAAGGIGAIVDLKIERELQDSYLTYAMSTIMDRALPDVRDGLKPSQRRLLFLMHQENVRPGRKHVKSANIVGMTMARYHPHGDAALYGTLVGMAQHWRARVLLVDPQGNFGSIDPDPPAAMRYTEARMAPAAADLLEDISLSTVDMHPNYDDTRLEPAVLPGKFPNLLINGGVGIAVGLATSLPPNNPVEVLDSIIRVIENPALGLRELMTDVPGPDGKILRQGMKGPDFPTGGLILGRRGIIDGYETGRGKVTVRGAVKVEPVAGSKDRQQLVIESVPYNLGLTTLVERIVEGVKEDKISDVSDVRNESGRQHTVRVVLELKKSADAAVVEKQLYEFTPLQQTFSMNNIALVNRRPRALSLREMIDEYIAHRADVIRRRTQHLLEEARRKGHILEGMIYAVCEIDEVIRLIRASRTRQEAIEKLMARRFRIPASHPAAAKIPERLLALAGAERNPAGVALSRLQAETIGSMRLIQLVGLEIEKLVGEYTGVVAEIAGYEKILGDQAIVMGMVKADCEAMKARYSSPRQTQIQDAAEDDFNIAALIPVGDCAVTISREGYAKRVPLDTYRAQGRGGKGIIGAQAREDDYIEHVLVASTHDDLLVFTNTGRVFVMKVFELPELPRTAKGRSMVNLLEFKEGEKGVSFLAVKNFEEGSHYLAFVSRGGVVKRTALKDYRNVHKGGLIAVDIREGDALLDVLLTTGNDDLLLATADGMAIRFHESDARLMGRAAAGVKGIELAEKDEVIGAVAIPMRSEQGPGGEETATIDATAALLTITENGFGKRTPVDEYRVQPETGPMRSQSRGGKGRVDIATEGRNGRSVAALLVHEGDDVMVVTKGGQMVRMPCAEIRTTGRGAQGVRVVKLDEADSVAAASRVPGEAAGGGGEGEGEGGGEITPAGEGG